MQMHRIFIAINLPETIKEKLLDFQKSIFDLPVRWTKKENLHITLEFLGYLNNEELYKICEATEKIASKHQSFSLRIEKISYGPPDKKPPRMIWAVVEKSKELTCLQSDLKEALHRNLYFSDHKLLRKFKKEAKASSDDFSPHITLGRIKKFEWQRKEPEEIEDLEKEINLSFQVNSIEVMESILKRKGPDYFVLKSCPLGS